MVRALGAHGHERRFKRNPRTSASPLLPDIVCVARSATNRLTKDDSPANRGEHRQAAGDTEAADST
jgi:hypothetical protein